MAVRLTAASSLTTIAGKPAPRGIEVFHE
ncbi:hypothetical protein EMIT0P12_10512 [Pseudomonas sp. IT-P12]